MSALRRRWPLRRGASDEARIELKLGAGPEHDQGYRLLIRPERIEVDARSAAGLRHGVTTLVQLIDSGAAHVAAMRIEDWPDFAVRGVMLDVSRCKVPTQSELCRVIDELGRWKFNQLQLYTEHTFAYRRHRCVWRGASPLTAGQVRRIDRLAARSGIELVPNQNSFGHMERWLRHRRYAPFAETREPWRTPWGDTRTGPATLNPIDPRSLKLITGLYDELLPNYSSNLINVGCDETFELGQGASRAACLRRGRAHVYADFVAKIHRALKTRRRRMMFWADMVLQDSAALDRIGADAIPLIWGYEANHPFGIQCRRIARTRRQFYVCPGTSSWCSFAGRYSNAAANIRRAAAAGRRHGATGLLLTDWGDFGHRQWFSASQLPIALAAAEAWCGTTNAGADVSDEVSRRCWGDDSGQLGRLWKAAGDVHEALGVRIKNQSALFAIMQAEMADVRFIPGLAASRLGAVQRTTRRLVERARSLTLRDSRGKLAQKELLATLRVLHHACVRGRVALARRTDAAALRWLAADMRGIITTHRQLWRRRHRPGGCAESLGYYRRNLREYELRPRR